MRGKTYVRTQGHGSLHKLDVHSVGGHLKSFNQQGSAVLVVLAACRVVLAWPCTPHQHQVMHGNAAQRQPMPRDERVSAAGWPDRS